MEFYQHCPVFSAAAAAADLSSLQKQHGTDVQLPFKEASQPDDVSRRLMAAGNYYTAFAY